MPYCFNSGHFKERETQIQQDRRQHVLFLISGKSTPIYQNKMKALIRKEICTPMFPVALITIAKLWKQPKCPSIDEQIKMMLYTCIQTYIHRCMHAQLCLTLCDSMDCSPSGSSSIHEIFSGKNTGVGCYFLLQGILPTQGLNLCLLYFLH